MTVAQQGRNLECLRVATLTKDVIIHYAQALRQICLRGSAKTCFLNNETMTKLVRIGPGIGGSDRTVQVVDLPPGQAPVDLAIFGPTSAKIAALAQIIG